MGHPPAYVFVVRHGARLDQADKRWHLASATPYDPPLTYGGWLQTQAVGARIASILRQAEVDSEQAAAASGASRKRKRFRIAIHSSPFLRCVQSSVGIAAGLAQEPLNPNNSNSPAVDSGAPVFPATAPSPRSVTPSAPLAVNATPKPDLHKTPLRIDAFLGEWLNPEYFESITHPPGSSQLISTAKIALLRKETISAYAAPRPHANSMSSTQGQLWSSPRLDSSPGRSGSIDGFGLNDMPAMASALPRNRADSAGSMASARSGGSGESPRGDDGYVAPMPSYAISTNDKIPDGYVAHARDACSAIDYQWDTTDKWGDGGSFGEEWAVMHRRFRAGFQKLVDWYSTTEKPAELVTKTGAAAGAEEPLSDDEEIENVVVIVSHGAGCNAMIGAITRQPVLMNVGVASLTMATRKVEKNLDLSSPDATLPIDQYYDLKIQASNEHLRNTVPRNAASGLARTLSNSSNSGFRVQPRGRVSTMSSYGAPSGGMSIGLADMDLGGSRSNSTSAALGGGIRKTSDTGRLQQMTPLYTGGTGDFGLDGGGPVLNHVQPITGLWAPTQSPLAMKSTDDEMDDLFPDFDGTRRLSAVTNAVTESTPRTQPSPDWAVQSRVAKVPPRLQEISRPASRDGDAAPENAPARTSAPGAGLWGT